MSQNGWIATGGGSPMPAISPTRPRIVDADGHVLEHPTAMLE
jgi:hypothetical protein